MRRTWRSGCDYASKESSAGWRGPGLGARAASVGNETTRNVRANPFWRRRTSLGDDQAQRGVDENDRHNAGSAETIADEGRGANPTQQDV